MQKLSRRAHLKGMLGMAAVAGMPRLARAEDPPIPPEGIGNRIKHVSYSDIGGRPDSIQIMSNRKHLYVGHMFSDGVTILDAIDPRNPKPVNFFTAGQYTRTHHMQSSDDILLLANGANIVAMQSYSDQRGYGAWRDGGFTIHDISDATAPKLLSHINWSPPFPGGTHTPLPLPGRNLAVVADEANAEKCAKGLFQIFVLDVRSPENPIPISTLPVPRDRDYCAAPGTFGPHNLHENRPGSFQSEQTIFATYNAGGVRIFDLKDQFAPKELAFWLPPAPARLIDPRPNVALAAKTADIYVTRDGLIYVTDWNAGLHVLEYQG